MKLGLKIATLVFFISGIVFFVGYQSGYFFSNESMDDKPAFRKKEESRITIRKDDSIENVSNDSLNKWLGADSITEFGVRKKTEVISKEQIIEPTEEDILRMSSSKSVVISRTIEYPRPFMRNLQKLLFKTRKKERTFLPSSKSGPVNVDLDYYFPQYVRPNVTTPTQWPSITDSLK